MAFDPKKFLDSQGVTKLWQKIQNNLNNKIDSLDTNDIVTVSKTGKAVIITGAIKEVDGLIQKGEAADITLADVASTGNAEDVAIADAGNLINASTVEGALQEIASNINANDAAAKVTMESAAGSGDTLTTYDFYQGVLGTDDAAAKAAKKIGTINIPKDYLVRSANILTVEVADEPYAGAKVGDKYIDFVVNTKDGAGTGTPQHMYIALNDLVAVMTGSTNTEITISVENNVISATVNEIAASKVKYAGKNETVEAALARIDGNDTTTGSIAKAVKDAVTALDSNYVAAGASAGANVSSASTVNAVSKVDIVDGKLTNSSESVLVDAAGAAAAAKREVIGASTDATTAETVYGAKNYASSEVNAAYAAIQPLSNSEIQAAIDAANA